MFDGRLWDSFIHQPGAWLTGVTTVLVDPANSVWIATHQFVVPYRGYEAGIVQYNHKEFTAFPLGRWEALDSKIHSLAVDGEGSIVMAKAGHPAYSTPGIYKSTFQVKESTASVPYKIEEPWFLKDFDQHATFSERVLLDDASEPLGGVTATSDGGFFLRLGRNRLVRTDDSPEIRWTREVSDLHVVGIEEAPGSGCSVFARDYSLAWGSPGFLKVLRLDQNGRLLWERELHIPPSLRDPSVKGGYTKGGSTIEGGNWLVASLLYLDRDCCGEKWRDWESALTVFDSSGTGVSSSWLVGSRMRVEGLLVDSPDGILPFGRELRGVHYTADHDIEGSNRVAPFLKMTSTDGGEIWHYKSPVQTMEYRSNGPGALAVRTTNGMYLLMGNVGSAYPARHNYNRVLLAMLSDEGEVIWENVLDRSGFHTIGWDLVPYPGGGAIILFSFEDGDGEGRVWMSRIDEEGQVQGNWDLGAAPAEYLADWRWLPRLASSADGSLRVFGYREDGGALYVKEVVPGSTDAETESKEFLASEEESLAPGVELYQNYPNPFNSCTTVRFNVAEEGPVSLRVVSLHGALVAELADAILPAGDYIVPLEAGNLASGVYLCRLQSRGQTASRKMLIMR